MFFIYTNKGFSILEIIIVLAILGLIGFLIATFQVDLFVHNSYLQEQLSAQQEIRSALRVISSEIRPAASANTGAYPIAIANIDEFMFYTDTDGDGLYERIRYYLDGTNLMRGELIPTESPLSYIGSESVSTLVHNISTSTIFNYYGNTYTGSESPLNFPVNTIDVRIVEIIISVDKDLNKPPGPVYGESKVFIRSLRDNP